MARIAGREIPNRKRSEIALTYVYGIGRPTAQAILKKAGISYDKIMADFTSEELAIVMRIIAESYKIEGEARAEKRLAIKSLMEIGCYRGKRHRKGLRVNGARTKKRGKMVPSKKKPIGKKHR